MPRLIIVFLGFRPSNKVILEVEDKIDSISIFIIINLIINYSLKYDKLLVINS